MLLLGIAIALVCVILCWFLYALGYDAGASMAKKTKTQKVTKRKNPTQGE